MIDARIPLGVQPMQIESPLNAMAQVMQVQGMQDQAAMRRLQMEQAKREREAETALSQAYASSLGADGAIDRNAMFRTLAGRGLGAKIPGLQKQFADADKSQLEVREKAAANYKSFQEAVASYANDPNVSKAMVASGLQQAVQAGAFDPKMASAMISDLPDDPAQLRQRLQMIQRARLSPEHQITLFAPKPTEVDDGQQKSFRDTNPLSPTYGQATAGAAVQKQVTPDAVMSAETARRGQNMVDARARESQAIQRQGLDLQRDAARTEIKETAQGFVMVDKGKGTVTPLNGADGKPLPAKPSESQQKELMSIRQQREVVKGAIAAASQTPSAFSLGRGAATMAGAIPESIAGRMDSDPERQARAYVFNNVSKVINERAGAAQSAQELARLRSFLPAETDNAEQIVSKLHAFNDYLNDVERGTRGASPAPTRGWSIQKVN